MRRYSRLALDKLLFGLVVIGLALTLTATTASAINGKPDLLPDDCAYHGGFADCQICCSTYESRQWMDEDGFHFEEVWSYECSPAYFLGGMCLLHGVDELEGVLFPSLEDL